METIKISLEVNLNQSESTMKFLKSFIELAQQQGLMSEGPTPAKPAPAKPAPAKPAPAKPAPAQEASSDSKSIEDIRALLVTKVNDHRAAIKQKLEELGAPSVSKLDPSKYDEIFNFLKSL